MLDYVKTWVALKTDNRGVTMVEYAIMTAVIAAALVLALPILNKGVSDGFTNIAASISGAGK